LIALNHEVTVFKSNPKFYFYHGGRVTAPVTHVAVGVLCNSAGEVLFSQRPAGKPMAGFWEFAGGKLEAGESVHQALARELQEELGIEIGASVFWRTIEHVYPHAHVQLHFQLVHEWHGTPHGREAQALHWQRLVFDAQNNLIAPHTQPILPATIPLLRDLAAAVSGASLPKRTSAAF
jgi:8-oxo-dGTP diphosphatase